MTNVKKIGNAYEKKFCEVLKNCGWWAHIFEYNASGQPCDVVAIRNNIAILVDVKHCKTDRFPFSDIQANQLMCFEYANKCGNDNTGFMIYFDSINSWQYLPYSVVKEKFKQNEKSIKYSELEGYTDLLFEEVIY